MGLPFALRNAVAKSSEGAALTRPINRPTPRRVHMLLVAAVMEGQHEQVPAYSMTSGSILMTSVPRSFKGVLNLAAVLCLLEHFQLRRERFALLIGWRPRPRLGGRRR
jgi:hypothetical protein